MAKSLIVTQEDKLGKLWTLQEGLYTTCIYLMTHP